MNKLKFGHIVYTASDKCILDIGWIESVNPLVIQARATKYDSITDPRRYGGVQYAHWKELERGENINDGKEYTPDMVYIGPALRS